MSPTTPLALPWCAALANQHTVVSAPRQQHELPINRSAPGTMNRGDMIFNSQNHAPMLPWSIESKPAEMHKYEHGVQQSGIVPFIAHSFNLSHLHMHIHINLLPL